MAFLSTDLYHIQNTFDLIQHVAGVVRVIKIGQNQNTSNPTRRITTRGRLNCAESFNLMIFKFAAEWSV